MLRDVRQKLVEAVKELFDVDIKPQVSVPDEQFGDVASNVAMQLAKSVGKNPREIAEQLAEKVSGDFAEVAVAGPGFLNIRFTDEQLWNGYSTQTSLKDFEGKSYVIEYSCPNWFKELHTGHLYQTVVGDALARMVEKAGADVHRTTFGGDVGLHVARALWSILSDSEGYEHAKSSDDPQVRAAFITQHYVKGSAADEEGGDAQAEIASLNKKIYELNKNKDAHPDIAEYYFTCRDWSTDYFHYFYDLIDVDDFERYYPESMTEELGVQTVKNGLDDGVFTESDGAVIYEGEKEGLHTRVFMTRENLPTYEAKDLGVILLEKEHFDFDHRILMTGSDQSAYMQVVWAALNDIDSRYRGTMTHLTNGIIKFADGSKMSSRLGNVTRAVDVIEAVSEVIENETQSAEKEKIVLGAIKYEFLKYHIGSDISFDVKESVSTKGNSGPYLQYAYVRAQKILDARPEGVEITGEIELDEFERRLTRKLAQYQDIFAEAVHELAPNTLCLYLYELAQTFNQFYENDRVVDSDRPVRWEIVARYVEVLGDGLAILGIETPESM